MVTSLKKGVKYTCAWIGNFFFFFLLFRAYLPPRDKGSMTYFGFLVRKAYTHSALLKGNPIRQYQLSLFVVSWPTTSFFLIWNPHLIFMQTLVLDVWCKSLKENIRNFQYTVELKELDLSPSNVNKIFYSPSSCQIVRQCLYVYSSHIVFKWVQK